MSAVYFKAIGVIGLICIILGVISKKRLKQDIAYIWGGVFLAIYSIYLRDVIFIILQVVFTIVAVYDYWKLKKK